ncbi:MAG: helix-turn-helix domain-containing protein [Arcobacter sp.]
MRNELGKKIRELREERGYSTRYVANKIGVSDSAYRSYENGNRKPDVVKIVKIAKVLNVSPSYLLEDYPKNLNELEEMRNSKIRKMSDIAKKLQLDPMNEDLANELKQLQIEIGTLDKEIFIIDAQLSLKRVPILKNASDVKTQYHKALGTISLKIKKLTASYMLLTTVL